MSGRWLMSAGLLGLTWVVQAPAVQFYQLGGLSGRPWATSGTLTFIDSERVPGSIFPYSTTAGQNLAAQLLARGGSVTTVSATEAIPTDWNTDRHFMVDGDSTTAFVHEPQINIYGGGYYSIDMRFDLGAPFPVERLRVRTRSDHPENLLRSYQLWLNDGSEATQTQFGDPIWTLVRDEPDNLKAVIELEIEPQVVRYLRLEPWKADVTWEIAELEVYGQGFVPLASFVSAPIDLGAIASLGRVWWSGGQDPQAKVLIQSRSGSDDQPEIYWRKTGIGDQEVPFDESGKPLTAESYRSLAPNKKGRITQDTQNWSVWQTYEFERGLQGTPILSPSPRRYVQFRIDFLSAGLDGGHLDSLWFEYSQPPLARQVIGEIEPKVVEPGVPVRFTYLLRARLDPGQRGFNALEVRAPAQIEAVHAVRLEGVPVDFHVVPLAGEPPGFAVYFPRIVQDQTRLEVDFSARIFRYGTLFSSIVSDAEGGDIGLAVDPGNAVDEVDSDALSVQTILSERLLSAVEVGPTPFSPNGDGVNDRLQLGFSLLQLTREVPLRVAIYDLAGRCLCLLRDQRGSSAAYQFEWDGRDGAGILVPPGIYLYLIEVEAARGQEQKVGRIVVVY